MKLCSSLEVTRSNRFRRAKNGAADGLVLVGGFGETIENDVVRRIVRRADFLQNHVLFAFEFLGVKIGIGQNVRQDIDGQRHIVFQHARIIRGGLDAGCCIDFSTDIFNVGCDLPRRAFGCALEGHVFEKMSDAMFFLGFTAGAGF